MPSQYDNVPDPDDEIDGDSDPVVRALIDRRKSAQASQRVYAGQKAVAAFREFMAGLGMAEPDEEPKPVAANGTGSWPD